MKANFKTFIIFDISQREGRVEVCEFLTEIGNRVITMTENKNHLTVDVTVWYWEKDWEKEDTPSSVRGRGGHDR